MENGYPQKYWWEESKDKIHESVFGTIRFLDQNQGMRRQANLHHMRLYNNSEMMGFGSADYALTSGNVFTGAQLKLNVIYSCCDTITNKIAKNKIKPMFLTEGGDWGLKEKAELLTQFAEGIFYETGLYKKSPKIFRSGTVMGTGAIKIFRQKDKIKAEPVFIDQIRVENTDGRDGHPRSMFQETYVARDALMRKFPKFKDKIKETKRAETSHPVYASIPDPIKVVEAWHLRSDAESKDGVHAITIDNATLSSDEWTRDYFPFVFQRWAEGLLGFFGQGLAEQLFPIQLQINKLLETMEESFKMCVPHMMVENGSDVVLSHLNNQVAAIWKYSGVQPTWTSTAPVNPVYFEFLKMLVDYAYEKAGISQLSASSQKPGGLNSGKALREFNDIETERYMLLGQSWEDFHLECTERFIDLAQEISEDKSAKDYTVSVKTDNFIKKIKWSEVKMDRDCYQLQCFPTSFLSSTPSGKFSDVQELTQAGFLPKEFAMKLLDFPDLKWANNLFTAAIDDIDATIQGIVSDSAYEAPESYQDLSLGVKMMQSAYLRMKREGLKEEKLDLMRRWIDEAQSCIQDAAAAQAAAQQGPGSPSGGLAAVGPQQAQPMPAPQSNMLPNAAS